MIDAGKLTNRAIVVAPEKRSARKRRRTVKTNLVTFLAGATAAQVDEHTAGEADAALGRGAESGL
jgi:hypothetical protein